MAGGDACIARCAFLVRAARRLGVPVLASEQYPQGLGRTVPALAGLLDPAEVHAKLHFAGPADPALRAAIEAHGRDQVVLGGMEAHVCVLQTALQLKALGLEPIVVADAVASRDPVNRELALARLRANQVEIASSEMVVFEWLGQAGTPAFKELVALIK
jgi:nicotinamidase-related amidase